ncbi:LOG family protein YvdD [Aquimarina aggregata]|uniref:Cytokinin riboside 5'-monophosphate phosphoribohydrolase n=1 Tax=Aquimarina aggregata TaxID=1642818 RepID=A0A162CVT6_9FLAO|nr:TIGR00730 family Rossman fold protein [Aquimarina aggregata]KZS41819.1 LOG family protein YvdD [Aquimarina aggregata]
MTTLNSICVFCGSSEGNDITIIEKGFLLGEELARRQITLVYGAAKIGIMGKVAEGALTSKGKVIGVIPEFLKLKEVMHLGLHELITTENMHQRKMKMHDLSDGFITLPGGFGTLEELFEIITWAQLGLHQKPIGLLNVGGFYDDLLQLLETMVRRGFLKIENYELLIVDDSIDQLLEKMKMFKPKEVPKWLKPERT